MAMGIISEAITTNPIEVVTASPIEAIAINPTGMIAPRTIMGAKYGIDCRRHRKPAGWVL